MNQHGQQDLTGFDLISNASLKAAMEKFNDFHKGYCGSVYIDYLRPVNFMPVWELNVHQQLGNFIIDANDPHSAFSKYFFKLNKEAMKETNDRVRYALEGVIGILNGS